MIREENTTARRSTTLWASLTMPWRQRDGRGWKPSQSNAYIYIYIWLYYLRDDFDCVRLQSACQLIPYSWKGHHNHLRDGVLNHSATRQKFESLFPCELISLSSYWLQTAVRYRVWRRPEGLIGMSLTKEMVEVRYHCRQHIKLLE